MMPKIARFHTRVPSVFDKPKQCAARQTQTPGRASRTMAPVGYCSAGAYFHTKCSSGDCVALPMDSTLSARTAFPVCSLR